MPRSIKKSFRAILEPDGTRLRWIVARVPFDPLDTWPLRRGRRVRGEIDGFPFRTSLFPDSRRQCHILLVNKQMLAATGTTIGSRVAITLEPDLEDRPVLLSLDFSKVLKSADRRLPAWFAKISPSYRREIDKWVSAPKSAPSRLKRAEQIVERLLQAMEGESDPPPILRHAFQRQPLAEKGWWALTPIQRRGHLLGIFYYQTPEARGRRTAKAIDHALLAARKCSKPSI